jgi:hypothetical protein
METLMVFGLAFLKEFAMELGLESWKAFEKESSMET